MQFLKELLLEAQVIPSNVRYYLYFVKSKGLLPEDKIKDLQKVVQGMQQTSSNQSQLTQAGLPDNVVNFLMFHIEKMDMDVLMKLVDDIENASETLSITGYNKMRELSQAVNSSKKYLGSLMRREAVWLDPLAELIRMRQATLANNTQLAATNKPLTNLTASLKQLTNPTEQLALKELFGFAKTLPLDKLNQIYDELNNMVVR